MNSLCKYKNILGTPGKGIHSYRLFGVAIADVILTVLLALIITYLTGKSFMVVLIIVLLLGIILHKLFCIKSL
jgi:hypothetical protein